MGTRSLLKRRLRRWQQDWHRWQQRWIEPLAEPRRRWQRWEHLDQIRSLQRVVAFEQPPQWGKPDGACDRIALVCHYSPNGHLQRCIKRLISSLEQTGWSVWVISSGLDAGARAWCQEHQIGVLLRSNQGRDFGAFQDGWHQLGQLNRWGPCRQLLLLNDSVYPVVNLAESSWPQFLAGDPQAVVGFTDSYQNGYHLQSYALNIPGPVLQQPWWAEYWWNYPSWGNTATAIREGEIGLSQLLLRQGVALKALHGVVELRAWLTSPELERRLLQQCSESATQVLLQHLLESADQAILHLSPSHQLAIPLLLQGSPFIKRDLLESNLCNCLDPLLIAGGDPRWIDPGELVDFLRPPVIGYKA
jgi:hypothetical protein